MNATDFDLVVAGGGPNGAVAAALLARHAGLAAARVLLLAPELRAGVPPPAAPGAAPQLRVSAIARSSEWVLRNAGAWELLPAARLCAYERMRVWHESVPADGAGVLEFSAAELAQPDLGHIVENRELARAGLAAFEAAGGSLLAASLRHIEARPGSVRLSTSAGELTARLVVGADGGESPLRALLGIGTSGGDYAQDAIVATVRTERPHAHTAWQRFLDGGPVALLPLHDGSCSIVWSLPRAAAEGLAACTPGEFARALDAATDRVLGGTTLLSDRVRLPLRRSIAHRMVAARACLLGDAAHVIHPLAGQGVNLGYLDAAALCDVLAAGAAEREDPGAARLLRRYEQARMPVNLATSLAMSGFNEFFARGGARGWIAARALGLAGASALLRRGFARHALGLGGELPRLARGAVHADGGNGHARRPGAAA